MRLENKRLKSSKIIKTKKPKVHCIDEFREFILHLQRSFLPYMDLDCVPVHKREKINNLGQYPAVLPSKLVSNQYILLKSQDRRQLMKFYTITKFYYQDLN